MDVKTAFLNEHIQEEIYMEQPEGFISKNEEEKVCKLQRLIYGLKHASRNEPCVYKKASGSAVVFLVLHVDDIFMFGNDICLLTSVKLWLSKTFSMKDLGNASYILGIKIYRDKSRKLIGLSQSLYLAKVLGIFYMEQSKKGYSLVRSGIHMSKIMSPRT
ncbi:unnamed protein product [Prunus armeniaca]